MGLIKIFLSVFSLAFRALESVGILWDFRLRVSEFVYGKHGVTVREPSKPILKLPACVLVQYIKQRKLTCEEIIRTFIDRIHEVNPLLNAVVGDRFTEALEEARYIDKILDSCESDSNEEKSALLNKPLLGVPITVKESLACEGFAHSAGLVDRKDTIASKDARVVENLRRAGAIPIAVTNCSELCMWWETANNVYGRTNNPYDTSKIAGGSSGGEGAIISAAGSVCGVGSDVGKWNDSSYLIFGIPQLQCAFFLISHARDAKVDKSPFGFNLFFTVIRDIFFYNFHKLRKRST